MAIRIVLTTTSTREQALDLARALVGARLAACAQISAIESVYRWHGGVEHEGEFRLLLKTTAQRYAALEAALRERHPYELPAIVAFDAAAAETAFAAWVGETCADGAP